jgi:hypothetical protein
LVIIFYYKKWTTLSRRRKWENGKRKLHKKQTHLRVKRGVKKQREKCFTEKT